MAFGDLELKRIDKTVGERFYNRVPPGVRDRLRFEYRIEGQSVIISEVRPRWDKPEEWTYLDFAKLRYIRKTGTWKLYWKRLSGKWELYEPKGEAKYLGSLVTAVEEDRYGCFFG